MKRLNGNIEARITNLDIWLKNLNSDKFKVDYEVEGNSNFALPLVMNENFKDK